MNLLKYNNKKVKVITDNGIEYVGMCYFMDADTAEESEDIIDVKTDDGSYNMLLESMIKNIEILEK